MNDVNRNNIAELFSIAKKLPDRELERFIDVGKGILLASGARNERKN